MGKHSIPPAGSECLLCEHEAHEEGLCYHCGIFSDNLDENPCTVNLGAEREET